MGLSNARPVEFGCFVPGQGEASRNATHVRDFLVADGANRIRRHGHDYERFAGERGELHLESGFGPVHEHDGTDVASLEAFSRDVGLQLTA